MSSAATIFDGAKGEAFDEIRDKRNSLKPFLDETVEAWKRLSTVERTAENYNDREKVDDDVSTIVLKTTDKDKI